MPVTVLQDDRLLFPPSELTAFIGIAERPAGGGCARGCKDQLGKRRKTRGPDLPVALAAGVFARLHARTRTLDARLLKDKAL
ncbi:hypothetical protein MesoLjLc_46940 [Mesorhizobium sp. L-8-10]|nr:hypothetical protein MesoLjLc_46940 [Mesorhizobium sp. L-8-10]